jgi:DNA excision repair protein ERCC-1
MDPNEPSTSQSSSQLSHSSTGDVTQDDRTVLVNVKQTGNPLLKHLQLVKAQFVDNIEADYIFGRSACGIFLSLKYHNLYPNYIYDKMRAIGAGYRLKVLILLVDISDPKIPLRELTKFAIHADSTLMLCWSYEEAARHVETYKLYRNKTPQILMEKQTSNAKGTAGAYECVAEALSSVKRINKSDAVSLMSAFESLERLTAASKDSLSVCPGLGPQKAEQLHNLFNRSFVRHK